MFNYLKVPVEFCSYCSQNNLENIQRLYLSLKFVFPNGKFKQTKDTKNTLALLLGYTDISSISKLLNDIEKKNWIKHNSKTNYYMITSLDKLDIHVYFSKSAYDCTITDLSNMKAFNGGAMFTYLAKNNRKKVNKERGERKKGRSFHPLFSSSAFNSGEVAISGFTALFNISKSKAIEMKHSAETFGYISTRKQYQRIGLKTYQRALYNKYGEGYATIKDGVVYLQRPDLIFPSFSLRRRRKYGTY